MLGRDIRYFLGRHVAVSLILRPSVMDPRPVTISVLHLAIGPEGRTRHYGLKGLKRWNPKAKDMVELPVEFDLIQGRPVKP